VKVDIAADMEGISGIVGRSQISPPGLDLARGRRFLADDGGHRRNAAITNASPDSCSNEVRA